MHTHIYNGIYGVYGAVEQYTLPLLANMKSNYLKKFLWTHYAYMYVYKHNMLICIHVCMYIYTIVKTFLC